jgi:hypothetical protein
MSLRGKTVTRSLMLGALVLTIGLMASPALAVAWGPGTGYYNGIPRVTARGDFFNDRNAYAANTITYQDRSNDGNTVHATSGFYFWKPNSVGTTTWVHARTKSTTPIANTTRTETLRQGLDDVADRARAASKGCAQMGFPVPDKCSETFYPSFSY